MYAYIETLCVYLLCTYVLYLYVCIFARSIKWGLGAPSDKCLAISSANDVKRAKFMFQHDIDIFIYTHTYRRIQTHLYSSSSLAVRVRIAALAVWIFVCLWEAGGQAGRQYDLLYCVYCSATSEVKWPSNVLCRGTTHRIGSGRVGWRTITYTDSWQRDMIIRILKLTIKVCCTK